MAEVKPMDGQLWIDGRWIAGAGETALSQSPINNSVVWQGRFADAAQADAAVAAAYRAFATLRLMWMRIAVPWPTLSRVKQANRTGKRSAKSPR